MKKRNKKNINVPHLCMLGLLCCGTFVSSFSATYAAEDDRENAQRGRPDNVNDVYERDIDRLIAEIDRLRGLVLQPDGEGGDPDPTIPLIAQPRGELRQISRDGRKAKECYTNNLAYLQDHFENIYDALQFLHLYDDTTSQEALRIIQWISEQDSLVPALQYIDIPNDLRRERILSRREIRERLARFTELR